MLQTVGRDELSVNSSLDSFKVKENLHSPQTSMACMATKEKKKKKKKKKKGEERKKDRKSCHVCCCIAYLQVSSLFSFCFVSEQWLCLISGSLKGQVVWVTGASSGTGEALVYQLAAAGCRLVLSARRTEELERVKKQCLCEWAKCWRQLGLNIQGYKDIFIHQWHKNVHWNLSWWCSNYSKNEQCTTATSLIENNYWRFN